MSKILTNPFPILKTWRIGLPTVQPHW